MMTGKSVKDVDRYQTVLNSLLALEENKYCADCESKGKWFPSVSCFRLVPAWAHGRRVNRPSLIIYYAGKCGTAFSIHRPIAPYYGARRTRRLEHGMQLHHAKIPQVIGSKNGLKGENYITGWSEKNVLISQNDSNY